MKREKLIISIILALIVLGLLTAFFYPKKMTIGGMGPTITPGIITTKTEFSCIGITTEFCTSGLAHDYCYPVCYGLLHNKKCFDVFFGEPGLLQEIEKPCLPE